MEIMEYKFENPSEDLGVLNNSVRLANEFVNEENVKMESANNRANIAICLTGIYASIITALGGFLFSQNTTPILLLTTFSYVSIIVLLAISIYNSLRVIMVIQIDKIAPSLINDLQSKSEKEALQDEIKWKFWQYNQYNKHNMKKLFYLHRAQRGLVISTIALFVASALLLFNSSLITLEQQCYIKCFELIIGCIIILFSFFSNQILEKFSFWR